MAAVGGTSRCSVRVMSATKRSLTDRALHLRSPDSGILGQGVRYAVAGGTVAVWYVVVTVVLADVFGVPFQLALVIGWSTALLLHFSLQRFFVWVHHSEFALGLGSQVGRYLAVAGTQYAITALVTAFVPKALGVPVTPVYVATVVLIALTNFVVFRGGVFHPER